MDPHLAVKLNYTFTAVALAIQACNAAYCLQHALDRRTSFNSVLCACMIVYMASFIPLMFTSRMAVELSFFQDSPTSPFHAEFKKQQAIIQIWTALYGLGTFPYVILVQIRFRVVKAVFKYHKNWDHAFVGFTSAVWLATIAVCGVIYPPSVQVQGLATTAWTIYALLCENLLSFIFISQLFQVRRQLNSGIEAQFQKVRRSLFFLCSMTWIGLALSLIAWTYYANDGMMRTLFFRASMTFSPLAYSGALVYIYTVRTLFQPKRPTSRYGINGLKTALGKSAAILRSAAGSTVSLSTPTSQISSLMPLTKGPVDSGINDMERVASPYGAAAAPSSDVENQVPNSEIGEHEPPRPLNPKPKSIKRVKSSKKAKQSGPSELDQEAVREHGADVENQLETFGVTVGSPVQASPLAPIVEKNHLEVEN
ncbi:hypothetical protein HDU89_007103 [Geranomyces variabilis]|nr:hypothetical protein HDU89_007103 [Geranomyces variabilis]